MSQQIKYICSCCGQEHESWPALTFILPDPYLDLTDEEKEEIAEIDKDFCIIHHADQTDYLIRCTLTQKVNNHCEDLDYGIWVSVSEQNFNEYKANYHNTDYQATYFGWLCSAIWGYEFDEYIPTNVITQQQDGHRPEVMPHEDCEHPFVVDYYRGISKEEAEARIRVIVGEGEE